MLPAVQANSPLKRVHTGCERQQPVHTVGRRNIHHQPHSTRQLSAAASATATGSQQQDTAQAQEYKVEKAHTSDGAEFEKYMPLRKPEFGFEPQPVVDAPPPQLLGLNHASLLTRDVEHIVKFYTDVLGFSFKPRPPLKFEGAWLSCGDFTLHIISADPIVPVHSTDWKAEYDERPEPWFIRRGRHFAFHIEDVDSFQKRLEAFSIEYAKFVLPGGISQLFFFDPEGNGVEVGSFANVKQLFEAGSLNNNSVLGEINKDKNSNHSNGAEHLHKHFI